MSSKAKLGVRTQLKIGDGASPEVFTTIAEILTLKFSGKKVDLVKVSNQDSSADANGQYFHEYITGFADGGTCDFTANFIPNDTSQDSFFNKLDGKPHNFKIVLPNNPTSSPLTTYGTYAFAGYIIEDSLDFPIDKQMTKSGKIQITGPVTYTANA